MAAADVERSGESPSLIALFPIKEEQTMSAALRAFGDRKDVL